MSIKGSDNSDTRQKRSGEEKDLGSSLPCTTAEICLWLFVTKDEKKKKEQITATNLTVEAAPRLATAVRSVYIC